MKNVLTLPGAALLGSLSLATLSLSFSVPAEAINVIGFQSEYAPANWTFVANGGDGSVNTTGAPNSIRLSGDDSGVGGFTNFTINSLADGQVSFDWSYSSGDEAGYDSFLYLLNGTYHFLTDSNGQTGTTSFAVAAGDSFGFSIFSTDGTNGSGNANISNFSAPATPVPFESDALPIVGSALFMAGGVWWKKKRAGAKVSDFIAQK